MPAVRRYCSFSLQRPKIDTKTANDFQSDRIGERLEVRQALAKVRRNRGIA